MKYVFIINPNSGSKNSARVIPLIEKYAVDMEYTLAYTTHSKHATEIATQYLQDENTTLVIVGGDGTINEVAHAIVSTHIQLGIIPRGSGNGFAGHLDIPKNIRKAIECIKAGEIELCDVVSINNRIACNTSGFGFDGFIAKKFGANGKRGFWSYMKLGLKEFYLCETFDIHIGDISYKKVFTLEIANSSQLGNKAIISPHSSVTDGIAELVFFYKPKWWQVPIVLYRVFNHSFHKSKLTHIISAAKGSISFSHAVDYHIDGEYAGTTDTVEFRIFPLSLKVLCKKN